MTTKAHSYSYLSYLFLYIGAFVLMLFLVITASKTMEYQTGEQSLRSAVGEQRISNLKPKVNAASRQIKNFNANERKKRIIKNEFIAPTITRLDAETATTQNNLPFIKIDSNYVPPTRAITFLQSDENAVY